MSQDEKEKQNPTKRTKKSRKTEKRSVSPVKELPRINLQIFEGPLDLLLYLIRKNECDIFDIPISEITRQYLDHMDLMKELDLEIAGEFLVMAATLMKIKSRLLLPRPEPEDEDEGEDPRAALVRQLLEYQKYKEAAGELFDMERKARDNVARTFSSPELSTVQRTETAYLDVDVYQLIEALRDVLNRLPEKQAHVIRMEPYSVRERMGQLVEIFKSVKSITFESLFSDASSRIEIITTFVALLEMIRLQFIKIYQVGHHEPIRITPLIIDESEPETSPEAGSGEEEGA